MTKASGTLPHMCEPSAEEIEGLLERLRGGGPEAWAVMPFTVFGMTVIASNKVPPGVILAYDMGQLVFKFTGIGE